MCLNLSLFLSESFCWSSSSSSSSRRTFNVHRFEEFIRLSFNFISFSLLASWFVFFFFFLRCHLLGRKTFVCMCGCVWKVSAPNMRFHYQMICRMCVRACVYARTIALSHMCQFSLYTCVCVCVCELCSLDSLKLSFGFQFIHSAWWILAIASVAYEFIVTIHHTHSNLKQEVTVCIFLSRSLHSNTLYQDKIYLKFKVRPVSK